MKLREIQAILAAEVFTGADQLDLEIEAGFGSDLMSDVLAFARGRVLLLTGLTNHHVIHTAAMVDAGAVVFVRGKRPDSTLINAAAELALPLLGTRLLMYDSCGRLFRAGLKGCSGELLEGDKPGGEKPGNKKLQEGVPGDQKLAGGKPLKVNSESEIPAGAAPGAIEQKITAPGHGVTASCQLPVQPLQVDPVAAEKLS
ncbi:hypothetical protein [Moorella sp. Hama-1]|uniref:hypothetical protein n=1 Tax=Moorella sp. Hama-1 TaxID=2138101 RepID=UPI0019129440|nr:hypothetical protein [Moorella sp. Hama-1]BCV21979.1 hypothetical protein hamaS1_20480 [Moorella sp. Hama-1]